MIFSMIKEIQIENFKSIQSLNLELGRLNVFIGANGSGKSNILEAIAFGSAAMENKLDDEFLANRGFRTTEPQQLKSGFSKESLKKQLVFSWSNEKTIWRLTAQRSKNYYGKWKVEGSIESVIKKQKGMVAKMIEDGMQNKTLVTEMRKAASEADEEPIKRFLLAYSDMIDYVGVDKLNAGNIIKGMPALFDNQLSEKAFEAADSFLNFVIYAPENYFLRRFEEEAQIKPLGFRGEGLFKLLTIIATEQPQKIEEISNNLQLLEWFSGFEIPNNLKYSERRLDFNDIFLQNGLKKFDQKNVNEGALFLLFYFTLFISDYTPKFFAIDNIDNAMNPKLGRKLVKILAKLAVQHDKQVILTTHNPAILDGLNLNDPEQRLFVVYRDLDGGTSVRRIFKKEPENGTEPLPLSEQFLRGYLGGLPDNF